MSAKQPDVNVRPGDDVKDIHVVFSPTPAREQLRALAAELDARRDEILEAWRGYGEILPVRSAGSSLSRAQFNDHIPAVLDSLSNTLRAWPEQCDPATEHAGAENMAGHGMERWQQGYSLSEVLREWGYLQMCVAAELERFAAAETSLDRAVMPAARQIWAQLCADGVTGSATQYGRLQQTESAGHVSALEKALSTLRSMEHARAEAWRSAAHDLRGSVTVVKGAANLNASGSSLPEEMRDEVAQMLSKGVSSLHEMLNELLNLARLEAGHEHRAVTSFDAAALLRDFCAASQASATDRGLFLKMDGPSTLPVEGDKPKVLRILQNLLLNAVKYTEKGGVSVSWGLDETRDTGRWTFSVQDTGPGLDESHATSLKHELKDATVVSEQTKDASEDRRRDMGRAETVASESGGAPDQRHGEGVGLSIVKRLCELLDASLELATEPGQGSTFRVMLPCKYEPAPSGTTRDHPGPPAD